MFFLALVDFLGSVYRGRRGSCLLSLFCPECCGFRGGHQLVFVRTAGHLPVRFLRANHLLGATGMSTAKALACSASADEGGLGDLARTFNEYLFSALAYPFIATTPL